MRLMTDGPDEVTLERARRQALTKAFEEADADKSGTLDAGEIMELLKKSDPLRTHSELDRQVGLNRRLSRTRHFCSCLFFFFFQQQQTLVVFIPRKNA